MTDSEREVTGGGHYPDLILLEDRFDAVLGPRLLSGDAARPPVQTDYERSLQEAGERVAALQTDIAELADESPSGRTEPMDVSDTPHLTVVNDGVGGRGVRNLMRGSDRKPDEDPNKTFLDMWSNTRIIGSLATVTALTAAAIIARKQLNNE